MLDLTLFRVEERPVSEVLDGIRSFTTCVNEPPRSSIARELPDPVGVVEAWEMNIEQTAPDRAWSAVDSLPREEQ